MKIPGVFSFINQPVEAAQCGSSFAVRGFVSTSKRGKQNAGNPLVYSTRPYAYSFSIVTRYRVCKHECISRNEVLCIILDSSRARSFDLGLSRGTDRFYYNYLLENWKSRCCNKLRIIIFERKKGKKKRNGKKEGYYLGASNSREEKEKRKRETRVCNLRVLTFRSLSL